MPGRKKKSNSKASGRGVLHILKESISGFLKDRCFVYSASISFFAFMAIVPLLFIAVTIFAYILGTHEGMQGIILSYLKGMLPQIDRSIVREMSKIVSNRSLGNISLIIFVLISAQLFSSIEHSVNVVFKAKEGRHFVLSVILHLIGIIFVGLLFVFSFVITSSGRILQIYPDIIKKIPFMHLMDNIAVRYLLPFFLVFLSFSWIYKFMPNRSVSFKNALAGGLLTAVLWETAKYLFTWYVSYIMDIGKIYGSLATFIVFLLWIFYSSSILLFGAEFVYHMEERKRHSVRVS